LCLAPLSHFTTRSSIGKLLTALFDNKGQLDPNRLRGMVDCAIVAAQLRKNHRQYVYSTFVQRPLSFNVQLRRNVMKLCFSSLGCPTWDLDTIIAKAKAYGYEGVDFRGLLNEIDVTRLPAFSTGAAETLRKFKDAGLEISGIASSITVCDAAKHPANIEEARRTIASSKLLGCTKVRIYGGGDLNTHTREELARIGLDGVQSILALDGAKDLHWLFETHDNWIKSKDCHLLLDHIPNPAFGALWDIGHTPRVGGETPEETYASIGKRVGHIHVKDALYAPDHPLAMADGWRYVIPGTGQLPLVPAIALLKAKGYNGWLVFEHEKRWHPELLEPQDIFPAFVEWARPLVG
jgi:sugar phosphate isomerase/epimerase